MLRFVSDRWTPAAVLLDASAFRSLDLALEAIARGESDALSGLSHALAWAADTRVRLEPKPVEAPLAPLLRVSRMLAALDPAPDSTLPVNEHLDREAFARAVAWAAGIYAPFRVALEAALEADDPDAVLPALAPPPEGTEGALAWLAVEPELAAVWCGTPAPEDVPQFAPELMLALFALHPKRAWALRLRLALCERLGADPSEAAAAHRPRLACRRVVALPTRVRCRLAGHTGRVVSLLAHPSRPLLLSGSCDGAVRVWCLERFALLRTLVVGDRSVQSLALDRSGTRLVAGSADRSVQLWDLDTAEHRFTLKDRSMGDVTAVAWSAKDDLVASASFDDQSVRVWSANSGTLRHTLRGHSRHAWALAAHPDDDLLASGSGDRTVRLWRFSTGECLRVLAGHEESVNALSASKRWLLSGSMDGSVRVWSWSGVCARVFEDVGALFLNSLVLSDSRMATLECKEGTVRVWNAESPDPAAWSLAGSLLEKASSQSGVALVGGGIACAAPGDPVTIAMWETE